MPSLQQLAAKYFPPEVVPKVLYVIQHESGGNPQAVGDGGAAYGLFQSHYIRPGASVEEQFADAARLYQQDLASGGSGFGDWGEGRTFNGQPFGALGNNPYPGDNYGQTVGPKIGQAINYSARPDVTPPKKSSMFGSGILGMAQDAVDAVKFAAPGTGNPVGGSSGGVTFLRPTGNFAKDSAAFSSALLEARAKLAEFLASKGAKLSVAKGAGGDIYGTIDVNNNLIPDPEYMKLFQEASYYAQALDQLMSDQKNNVGLYNDAAKAYLTNSLAEPDERRKEYTDWYKRMSDLASLEDIPVQRQMAMAQALEAANTANSKRSSQGDFFIAPRAPEQQTDFGPMASALKAGTPTAPPPMPQVPASVFAGVQTPPPGPYPNGQQQQQPVGPHFPLPGNSLGGGPDLQALWGGGQ